MKRITIKLPEDVKANFDKAHVNHIKETGKMISFVKYMAHVGKKLLEE